jgi:hypothetical protein
MAVPCRYPGNLGHLDNYLLNIVSHDLCFLGVPQKQASSDRLIGIRIARLIGIVTNRFTNGNIAREQNLLLKGAVSSVSGSEAQKQTPRPSAARSDFLGLRGRLAKQCLLSTHHPGTVRRTMVTGRLIPAGASSRLSDCPSAQ